MVTGSLGITYTFQFYHPRARVRRRPGRGEHRRPARPDQQHQTPHIINSRILDTSAIYAWSRRSPYVEAVVWSSVQDHIVIAVPIPALTAAYGQIHERDWDIVNALLDLPVTITVGDLTRATAPTLARTLRPAAGHAPAALTAASVVEAATSRSWPVLTGEPYPLHSLAPQLVIERLP